MSKEIGDAFYQTGYEKGFDDGFADGANDVDSEAKQALDAIYLLLDGKEWNADTLGAVAEVLDKAGYHLHDFDPA